MKPELVSGSALWQTIFVSFAAVLLLFQVIRGWRLGLPRQLVRLGALAAAYACAFFGGRMLLPFLRPILRAPDFVIAALGGVILAAIVYAVINTAGTILFKRTGQQESSLVRLTYGITGATLGFFFGLFFLWLIVFGIRSVGSVAEAQLNTAARDRADRKARVVRADDESLAVSLARLKKSIERGAVGDAVRQTDVIPAGVYETFAKLGETFAHPERASRFLTYPGVADLADNPKILALRADPEIQRMLAEGRFFELLQDERLIEVANDPGVAKQVRAFDLRKALDYAAER